MASFASESNGRVRKKEEIERGIERVAEQERERDGKVIDVLVRHRAHNSVTQEAHCSSLSDLLLPAHPPCIMYAVTSTHITYSATCLQT